MDVNNPIANRDMSGFPVSIGTGLALEAILPAIQESVAADPITPLQDLTHYSVYAFNIKTLIRNLLNSMKYDAMVGVRYSFFAEALIDEIEFIDHTLTSSGAHVEFFTNSYSYYERNYKDSIRKATTDKQIHLEAITDYCVKQVLTQLDGVKTFDKEVRFGAKEKVLLFSHYPVDLLAHSAHSTFDLLESHTAKIKTRKDWNSKYYKIPNVDMSFLPFIEYLLTTFGDNVMFKPKPMKERETVYNHMVKKNVNPLTSETSISFILGRT